ncbi:MAG: biopolymer transporter Tol [Ignavibacteriae bacterium]|nr:MAG: biopolymer transporter Tol [Ignavibacteriota bacterium]
MAVIIQSKLNMIKSNSIINTTLKEHIMPGKAKIASVLPLKYLILIISLVTFCIEPVFAQFGQNKVQYKTFEWSFIQSKHFDIYFSQGGEQIAQFTAVAAESSLVSLTDNIGYLIQNRIPIIVYNSHNEFQQNNVVDEYLPEGAGGVTELFKNRITVPFEGDYAQFRHVIHHELLHAFMNDMYYGGSIQNIITQNIKLQFPGWFSEGMAEYQSLNGNDKANDMFMRDAVVYDYLPPLEYIDGYLSYRAGQSFFSWLADTYGKEKIGNMMQQIKAIGDVDEGFKDVYKLTLEELSEKWHKALKQDYWPDISIRQELTDFARKITDHKKGDGFYNTAPAISPNGEKIAYISNRDDYFDVFIADVRSGRIIKKLIKGNRTANFEELHLLTPGLSWSPDGRKIAISVKSGSKDAIYIVDVNSEDEKELPIRFDGIFSVSWNPTNQSLAFVGDNAHQSDIWVYNITTKELQQITDDKFSDADPSWSRDGRKIYFSSDRGNYTDIKSIPAEFDMSKYDYSEKDLYVYDLNAGTLEKFTGDKNANESNVVSSPDGKKVLYISDKNGISNIYLRDIETNQEKPITNSIDPINLLSLSADGKKVAFTSLNQGGYDIFYMENPFDVDLNLTDLPKTIFVQEMNKERTVKDSLLSLINKDTLYTTDSAGTTGSNINNAADSNDIASDTIRTADDSLNTAKDTSMYGKDITLDLNPSYEDTTLPFSKRKLKLKEKTKFQLTDNLNEDSTLKVKKYKIKFSPDIIYSNVNYSSFYGVQGVAQMAFSDILGNHRIFVVTSLVLDLKNSDYAFGYYYLPKRIDYGFEAYHSARFLLIGQNSSELFRYRTYGLNLAASFPIDKFNRLEGALSYNHITKENLDNQNQPAENLQFAVPMLSYVHDNTLWGYTAPIRGTRYILTALGTPKLGSNGVSFFTAYGDYRTYFKFLEDYDFVLRLNGGVSVGKNPQRFYIGGTENWINYDVATETLPIEDIQDYAFSTPILPLRGYDYNARSGSKFALMNAELRFPLFKYLVFGLLPLAFQNVQGVAFIDAGTVWSKNKDLQLFTTEDGRIKTKDLLLGMGIGARIFLLYFPIKFDVAWSYDLQKFSKPKYYISIGADF